MPSLKPGLHSRNRHASGYDLPALVAVYAPLANFLRRNPLGAETIDFANPDAVLALNRALLVHDYGITRWEIPPDYLCPPIPGRADYIHHLADLLGAGGTVPRGPSTAILDIGVGANCIYPIIGVAEYDWRFVGTEVDAVALASAQRIVAANPKLPARVECRLQRSAMDLFRGVTQPGETFAASICNPPFHASSAEAVAGTQRKLRNLTGQTQRTVVRNFGGRAHELWCIGGERAFIQRMIQQSRDCPQLCRWFTTLVAKSENLPAIHRSLAAARPADVRTIDVAQGQKRSRILAWTFQNKISR